MLINGNNFNQNLFNKNKQFEDQKFDAQKNSGMDSQTMQNNNFTKELSAYQHVDLHNQSDMYDKSLAILQERLDKKLITLEEFNKKCMELGKKRHQTYNSSNNF